MPQRHVDIAPQIHLEIDCVAFGLLDGSKLLLETRIGGDIETLAQGAEQGTDAGDGGQAKSLAPGQSPLVDAAHQQGQAQGAGVAIGRGLRPVPAKASDLFHGGIKCGCVALQRQAEDAGEGILRHARGLALHVGRAKERQAVGGE